MPVSISGTNGVTFPDSSLQAAAASPNVLKNRIINGAMVIAQYGGTATVNAASNTYAVDRTFGTGTGSSGVFTMAQSSTAPTGFSNSLLITVTTADASLSASDLYLLGQNIEGFNTSDLDFGTANAKTITLSFWVRSSVTGTYGGSFSNSGVTRSYPFTYTISAANTWEQKTITIAGDTTGTWVGATNGVGLRLFLGLGAGSTFSGTAGSWQAADYRSATGATNLMATVSATFYITGVQLEIGTTATPFERRLYNQELTNCQRYFAKLQNDGTGQIAISAGFQTSTTVAAFAINFPVTMRAEPTVTVSNLQASDNVNFSNAWTLGSVDMGYNTGYLNGTISAAGAQFRPSFLFTANNTSGFLTLSAEL